MPSAAARVRQAAASRVASMKRALFACSSASTSFGARPSDTASPSPALPDSLGGRFVDHVRRPRLDFGSAATTSPTRIIAESDESRRPEPVSAPTRTRTPTRPCAPGHQTAIRLDPQWAGIQSSSSTVPPTACRDARHVRICPVDRTHSGPRLPSVRSRVFCLVKEIHFSRVLAIRSRRTANGPRPLRNVACSRRRSSSALSLRHPPYPRPDRRASVCVGSPAGRRCRRHQLARPSSLILVCEGFNGTFELDQQSWSETAKSGRDARDSVRLEP